MVLQYFDKIRTRLNQYRSAPDQAIVEMRGGYKLSLYPSSDKHERQLYFDPTYEAATLSLIDAVLRPGDVAVDVGANLGIMTMHAAKAVGATGLVVSLEPHSAIFTRLVDHVALNGLTNVRALQIAAGAGCEQRVIFESPSGHIGFTSLIKPAADGKSAGTVNVDRLDDILESQDVEKVRFLKIDVEGFEPNVLRGAPETLKKNAVICMEVSCRAASRDEPALAAHDIIMSTGNYAPYRFQSGKGRKSPLVDVGSRKALLRLHDNVVYIPIKVRRTLPEGLFAN